MANQYVTSAAAKYGVPAWIANDIVTLESNGRANAKGDYVNGSPTSFGLYQLHIDGGQGTGYSTAQLLNPQFNANLGTSKLVGATKAAQAKGLTGLSELEYVANNSGHPGNLGVSWTQAHTNYDTKLAQIYNANGGSGDTGTGTAATAPTTAAATTAPAATQPGKTLEYGLLALALVTLLGAFL